MRQFILFATLCMTVASANAETYERSIDVTFPNQVAGLEFAGRKEFPQKELGVNIGYQRTGPMRGAIFIYSGGLSSIPSGTDGTIVKKHFEEVIREVKQLESQGRVRAVNLSKVGEQVTTYPGCGPQFIWRTYEMDLGEEVATAYTYLTAMKNNFVKLRITFRKDLPNGERDAAQFVQQMRKLLGACKN